MLTAIFFYLFWACVLAGAVFVGFFMWLNSRDSRIDDRQYDPEFNPQKAVEINVFRGTTPDDKIDPAKALRAYAQPVTRPGQSSSRADDTPRVDEPSPSGKDEISAAEAAAEKNESGIE